MKYICLLLISLCFFSVAALIGNQDLISLDGLPQVTPTPALKLEKSLEDIIPNIPQATWEGIFFEGIDERTDEAGIKSLRKTSLAKDDIEVRIWMGFGLSKLEGFILRRIKTQWSADFITADYISKKIANRNVKLEEPKSGWEEAWQKLIKAEILTLPDADSINCNPGALDGFSFVVEAKKGDSYRTYMYENPDLDFKNKCPEAKQMLEIYKIVIEEFKIK